MCDGQQTDGSIARMIEHTIFDPTHQKGSRAMLFTIAIILLVLWALGLVSGTTAGGLVHLLLVIAIVVIVIQLLRGRRVV